MPSQRAAESPVPRWLHVVMMTDYRGSAWYVGASFLFAPLLALLSPWPVVTTVLWWLIGSTGLCLGLLGIALTTGFARVLRSGAEIPEEYWRCIAPWAWPNADHDSGGDDTSSSAA